MSKDEYVMSAKQAYDLMVQCLADDLSNIKTSTKTSKTSTKTSKTPKTFKTSKTSTRI